MSDLTNTDSFSEYIGSFWNQIFQDTGLSDGISDASSKKIVQNYSDVVEALNCLSCFTVPTYHRVDAYAITIRESELSFGPGLIEYGTGLVYGTQPEGSDFLVGSAPTYGSLKRLTSKFYIALNTDVVRVGNIITNSLYDPSVVLVNQSDWVFADGSISFRRNPFENELIPKRNIRREDGTLDREIVLFTFDVGIDKDLVHSQFGYIFGRYKKSSEAYRVIIQSLVTLYSDGPTLDKLDSLMASVCGQPVVKETSETVQEIQQYKGKTLIVTDLNAYLLDEGRVQRSDVVVGATLDAGHPLSDATEVYDRVTRNEWWKDYDVLFLGRRFCASSGIGIQNADQEPTIASSIEYQLQTKYLCRLEVIASESAKQKFWKAIDDYQVQTGDFLADKLWGSSNPDILDPPTINFLDLVMKELLGDHIIVINLKVPILGEYSEFLSHIGETIPVWSSILIFNEIEIEDGLDLHSDDTSITDVTDYVPFNLIVADDIDGFPMQALDSWTFLDGEGEYTTTVEALSSTPYADSLIDELDLSDSAVVSESLTKKPFIRCI